MATESTSAPSPTPLARRTFLSMADRGLSAAAAVVLGLPLSGYSWGFANEKPIG